jgi:hypothetical protein
MSIVQYITYNGKKYPIRISYYAIKMFQFDTKRDISEIDQDISLLEVLLWYGLIAGAKSANESLELKRDEMEFVLDESMNEFNTIIMEFFPLATDTSIENKKKLQ